MARGFFVGLLAGSLAAVFLQVQPRLACGPDTVFSGHPLGLDQWVYSALARAVWRSPTKCTYEYPFALFWPSPPVLIQLPITLVAWLGRVFDLPTAFELLRILGAGFSGLAVALIGRKLFSHPTWRGWFYAVSTLGGAYFFVLGIGEAIRTAGIYGLLELPVYFERAMAPIYWWLPFLAQNLWLPLEAVYHAMVLGAFALLLHNQWKWAALLGLAVWFSNPFPAVSLYSVALPWIFIETFISSRGQRASKLRAVALWLVTAVIGYSYYALFLPQWPVLKELADMHRVPLAPPPTWQQLIAWLWPAIPPLVWSVTHPAGRKHIWHSPSWRLMELTVGAQLALLSQFAFLGDNAVQPYHFNRGYLALAVGALVVRWLQHFSPRRVSRLAAYFLLSLCVDQCLFFLNIITQGVRTGFVPQEIAEIGRVIAEREGPQVFYNRAFPYSVYFAATSDHVPYDMPETMVVPWSQERLRIIEEALQNNAAQNLAALGVSLVIVTKNDVLASRLPPHDWSELYRGKNFLVFELEKTKRRKPPQLAPPLPQKQKP